MNTYKVKLYKFNELNQDAKNAIIELERYTEYGFGYLQQETNAGERIATLDAFCDTFGITYSLHYDHDRRFINWQFNWKAYLENEDAEGKYLYVSSTIISTASTNAKDTTKGTSPESRISPISTALNVLSPAYVTTVTSFIRFSTGTSHQTGTPQFTTFLKTSFAPILTCGKKKMNGACRMNHYKRQ